MNASAAFAGCESYYIKGQRPRSKPSTLETPKERCRADSNLNLGRMPSAHIADGAQYPSPQPWKLQKNATIQIRTRTRVACLWAHITGSRSAQGVWALNIPGEEGCKTRRYLEMCSLTAPNHPNKAKAMAIAARLCL